MERKLRCFGIRQGEVFLIFPAKINPFFFELRKRMTAQSQRGILSQH